jgi:nucleoside-specific outer membrane channel protein Tsx
MSVQRLFLFLLLSLGVSSVFAGSLLWQSNSIHLLTGDGFEVDPDRQTTLTLEHASGWSFGDLFFFTDLTRFHDSPRRDGVYGEFSPRFSLGKLSGKDLSTGPIKDVLIATTYEFGKGDVESFLIGPGLDLAIPGFDYFQLNLYHRSPFNGRDGEGWMLTPVWGIKTPFMGSELVFEGYMDWTLTDDGSYHSNLHFNPRLKFDLGKALGEKAGRVYIGVEYSHWQHKYGINGIADQNALSGLLNVKF